MTNIQKADGVSRLGFVNWKIYISDFKRCGFLLGRYGFFLAISTRRESYAPTSDSLDRKNQ